MNDMNGKIIAELDKTNPNWWLDWADQQTLRDVARGGSVDSAKRYVARIFHPILHAALQAGIVASK